jgi:lipopolysaccharide/colanic/teichoic acid biosynthesis glycosyltransferase
LLRILSLDELPQLYSVITGDMSLVGPRPPLPSEVMRYSVTELRRLEVKPGLTCLWQVNGRSLIPFEQQVALDIEYIERQSLRLDLELLARTIPAVLSCKGAF